MTDLKNVILHKCNKKEYFGFYDDPCCFDYKYQSYRILKSYDFKEKEYFYYIFKIKENKYLKNNKIVTKNELKEISKCVYYTTVKEVIVEDVKNESN